MARKKHKKRRAAPVDPTRVARPDWAQFRTGYHGQGPHRDASKYQRKPKHKEREDADE